MRWALLALALAGCAQAESGMLLQNGHARVEPHPTKAGAARLTVLSFPEGLDSATSPNTPGGRQRLAAALLGPNCAATEEARMPLAPDMFGFRREQIVMRVECP